MPRLLVVDDEPNVLFSLEEGLKSPGLDVITARTVREGIELVRTARPDAAVLDVRLPDMSGLDAFERFREIDPRLPVIIITAYASTEMAIEAMKQGAFDYMLKPLDLPQLRDVVGRAIELSRLTRVRAVFDDEAGAGAETGAETEDLTGQDNVDRIVGRSPAMQEVYKAIGRVANQDVTVLILGESGTGKELVARAIFQHGRRADWPFLAINCAAIPEALLESELFGHEKGAFTGADRKRIGKFEQADGGTLFLDEVGDMSGATQAKVLRLLQDGEFQRVGGNETIRADVRVIAATNQDLDRAIAEGRFRQDLYYRLNVFSIRLPPLRQRREDIPLLVEHFLRRFGREQGKPIHSVTPEVLERLTAADWPGNVRELQATIKSALIRATAGVLTLDCLPPDSLGGPTTPQDQRPGEPALNVAQMVRDLLQTGQTDIYARVIAAVDRVVLEEVLRHVQGNQVQASEALGIARNTLRAKLRSAQLSVAKQLVPETNPEPGSEPRPSNP